MFFFNSGFLYKFLGLVSKSANLTVHALLDQIRRYLNREGKFPRKLYLQFDGGAENANQTVLGWLQVLAQNELYLKLF